MTGRLIRNPIALAFGAILLLILLASTLSIVPETKQAVIVRFGEPDRIINPYRAGVPFGRTGAGIIARWPFAEEIHWIDKRILSIDMDRQQVLSTDQLRLQVDAFARYRITDPLRMFITARTEDRVSDQLKPILGSRFATSSGGGRSRRCSAPSGAR
jgi:membrane protease subunit HflC